MSTSNVTSLLESTSVSSGRTIETVPRTIFRPPSSQILLFLPPSLSSHPCPPRTWRYTTAGAPNPKPRHRLRLRQSETVAMCATLGRYQDVCKGSRFPVEGDRCVVSSWSLFKRLEVLMKKEKNTTAGSCGR